MGSLVRAEAKIYDVSRIFNTGKNTLCNCRLIADNATARGDAILEDSFGVKNHVTIWGENAQLLHDGLINRRVCIGPLKIVGVTNCTFL